VRSQALFAHTLKETLKKCLFVVTFKNWEHATTEKKQKKQTLKKCLFVVTFKTWERATTEKKKTKKQNQGREGKKLKIKIVCCVTPTMYHRWFFLSGSLWLRAIYQSWNQQWLLNLSVCTQSSPVLQCSWRIYLSNKERLIT
jgi:hypothetical protein